VRTNELLGRFNETAAKLNTIAADIEAGRGTLGKFIKDDQLHTEVQATVAGLRQITDSIQKGEGTIGKLLHDDKLYNSFNQTSSEVVKLLYDFRQNPRKYLNIKVSLF
jgi:phospholipid/cholesterol/gamma-HCH transport system substrate-binding protein